MQGPFADGRKSGNQLYRTIGGPALTKSPASPHTINARCIAPFEPRPLAAVTFPAAAPPRAPGSPPRLSLSMLDPFRGGALQTASAQ